MFDTGLHDQASHAPHGAASEGHPLHSLDALSETKHYFPGGPICTEASVCTHWYRLILGSTRRTVLTSFGTWLTLDVLAPGDFFGFYVPDAHGFRIEAGGEGAIVKRYPEWCVAFLAEVEPSTRATLKNLVQQAISRAGERLNADRRRRLGQKWRGRRQILSASTSIGL
jgi:hypothetical protein